VERMLNVMTGFSIGLLLVVLASLRRAHIRVEYSVSWIAASIVLLVLSRSQRLLSWLTAALGLSDPGLALIIMVFCVFLVVFYRFSVVVSDLKDANIAMAQRVAILEYQIESAHEQQGK
jgi:hypothetical protein